MTVKEIILDYLKNNNYDGLCNPDIECGCGIDDLMPCSEEFGVEDCHTAYKKQCKKCNDRDIGGECLYDCTRDDGCYSLEKQELS